MAVTLPQRLFAEALGTAVLLAVVVGSGTMAERLAGGNDAIALLANAIATGAGLYVLIGVLAPISGAHFNPAVTLAFAWRRELGVRVAFGYVAVQVVGAFAGVALAHAMFDLALLDPGVRARHGLALWLSEGVATAGLVATILLGVRHRPAAVPALVAAYIVAAYWFTASTSFANPAVTLGRAYTTTFSGIAPADAPGFVAAQLAGTFVGLAIVAMLAPRASPGSSDAESAGASEPRCGSTA